MNKVDESFANKIVTNKTDKTILKGFTFLYVFLAALFNGGKRPARA